MSNRKISINRAEVHNLACNAKTKSKLLSFFQQEELALCAFAINLRSLGYLIKVDEREALRLLLEA